MIGLTDYTVEKLNLKVIGAGLPRTGTTSLKEALTILGFSCHHASEMFKNNHTDLWIDILSSKSDDWKHIFSGYTATLDMPSVAVYQKLMEVCPDAKIILTVRDKEAWYQSVKDTLYALFKKPNMLSASELAIARLTLWEGLFERFEDREYAMSVYEDHVEAVKNYVPANKLLVFNVKEGWAPLCDFLGLAPPHPDTLFPHCNDTAQFYERFLKDARQGFVLL
ncbi:hypothetical protein SUGI_0698980 [Cryptomeria japonica]|nr:hypothetical protein SUGI_0698980 [Cryptomeria japonica]